MNAEDTKALADLARTAIDKLPASTPLDQRIYLFLMTIDKLVRLGAWVENGQVFLPAEAA